jgi:preprotein translocase subunit SecY
MFGGGGDISGKGLKMPLMETFRRAWADPDLKSRIMFILGIFAVYSLGVHISVPVKGLDPEQMGKLLENIPFFQMLNIFGGGALRRISIFALGLNPYITASIIIQILTTAFPEWKKELQEGGEYARRKQNKRTRILTLVLCLVQGYGLTGLMASVIPQAADWGVKTQITMFWTAGAMLVLWLGEQVSEHGIGNGVSLMIFAGIVISLPNQGVRLYDMVMEGTVQWWQVALLVVVFLATTWFIIFFTTAQRRIPIQHMRRMIGTKTMGGQTSYLPLSVNMVGVIPIIFAVSLVYMPNQFAQMFPKTWWLYDALNTVAVYMNPGGEFPECLVGWAIYTLLIFFFTYFYTAIQYNVEDIANNLKRGGSFIPGVRPGKQTCDFLDGVISRITVVGALFLSVVALVQYAAPMAIQTLHRGSAMMSQISVLGGTSLLIMVSVALETMRQIEASLLMKNY